MICNPGGDFALPPLRAPGGPQNRRRRTIRTRIWNISPNNEIPEVHGRDAGSSIFEADAILINLAEKAGSQLLPAAPARQERTA